MSFSFLEQVEENIMFNLTFPYHIKHENLLGNDYYNPEYPDSYHCHCFESVVEKAYREPKAFYLTEEDKKYYSEQEITFLNKVIECEINKIKNGYEITTLDLTEETIFYINKYKEEHNLTFENAIIDILQKIIDNPQILTKVIKENE